MSPSTTTRPPQPCCRLYVNERAIRRHCSWPSEHSDTRRSRPRRLMAEIRTIVSITGGIPRGIVDSSTTPTPRLWILLRFRAWEKKVIGLASRDLWMGRCVREDVRLFDSMPRRIHSISFPRISSHWGRCLGIMRLF